MKVKPIPFNYIGTKKNPVKKETSISITFGNNVKSTRGLFRFSGSGIPTSLFPGP
jgi:hypothetical protein